MKTLHFKTLLFSVVVLATSTGVANVDIHRNADFIELANQGNYNPSSIDISKNGEKMAVLYTLLSAAKKAEHGNAFVQVYDVKTKKLLKTLPNLDRFAESVYLSADSAQVIIRDRGLRTYSVADGSTSGTLLLRSSEIGGYNNFTEIIFSPDRELFTAMTEGGETLLVKTEDLIHPKRKLSDGTYVVNAKASTNKFAKVLSDGSLFMLKKETNGSTTIRHRHNETELEMTGVKIDGNSFYVSNDAKFLVTTKYEIIHIYSGTGELLHKVKMPEGSDIWGAKFVSNGKMMIKVEDPGRQGADELAFRYFDLDLMSGKLGKVTRSELGTHVFPIEITAALNSVKGLKCKSVF